jgi:hypothetical protein
MEIKDGKIKTEVSEYRIGTEMPQGSLFHDEKEEDDSLDDHEIPPRGVNQ